MLTPTMGVLKVDKNVIGWVQLSPIQVTMIPSLQDSFAHMSGVQSWVQVEEIASSSSAETDHVL